MKYMSKEQVERLDNYWHEDQKNAEAMANFAFECADTACRGKEKAMKKQAERAALGKLLILAGGCYVLKHSDGIKKKIKKVFGKDEEIIDADFNCEDEE